MEVFVLIIVLGITIIGIVLGCWVIGMQRKVQRLEKRQIRAIKIIVEDVRKIGLLTTGESVNLDQHERNMILSAIEYVPFREIVERPETKAMVRKIYRGLREKIQLSIKKEDGPQPVKEGNETKEA